MLSISSFIKLNAALLVLRNFIRFTDVLSNNLDIRAKTIPKKLSSIRWRRLTSPLKYTKFHVDFRFLDSFENKTVRYRTIYQNAFQINPIGQLIWLRIKA